MLDLTHERCDRCGARATAKAVKSGIYKLTFCSHHIREFHDALLDDYWLIEADVTQEYVQVPVKAN